MNVKIKEPFKHRYWKRLFYKMVCRIIMKQLKIKLKIEYDKSKPDGMFRKCLNIDRAKRYGWKPNNNFDNASKLLISIFEEKSSEKTISSDRWCGFVGSNLIEF